MTQELIHTRTGNVLRNAEHDLASGLYRIRIPRGTHLWRVGVQTYRVDEPARAWASFDAPPDRNAAQPVGNDTRETLSRLWIGGALAFYSPENSGTLSIAQPESTSAFRADRERWLYVDLQFPAGRTLGWQSSIEIDPAYAPAPPAPPALPEPDLALAQRTLTYAHEAGLVAALMHTSGAHNDEGLIDWMTRQGDLWFAICRLAGLAERKGIA